MLGLEAVSAVAVTWLWRRLRKPAERAGEMADSIMTTQLDRLENLMRTRLGDDSAFVKLEGEAESGAENSRTRQRMELALQDVLEEDPGFGAELRQLVDVLESCSARGSVRAGRDLIQNTGSGTMFVNTGSGNLTASRAHEGDQDGQL